ncbi:hypothetical protein Taro_046503 [Colocasia esculenta]|uniref:Uncharacterized protein n=1 Tax=Colocasia esculenta TaxID=4460 RepID=A0A843X7G2_COLES|nr:hypothetical protein [Colocasia esculenta]
MHATRTSTRRTEPPRNWLPRASSQPHFPVPPAPPGHPSNPPTGGHSTPNQRPAAPCGTSSDWEGHHTVEACWPSPPRPSLELKLEEVAVGGDDSAEAEVGVSPEWVSYWRLSSSDGITKVHAYRARFAVPTGSTVPYSPWHDVEIRST